MASLKKGGTSVRKGQSQLRSPIIKRLLTAPVTLQGWLHKQGSDGLMLWKKRWFVVSDYCLFYYKGPEEEKLLGSFLLASYKISPCSAEDKVYRKYSFKAEHANMRTYYFAADNQALMAQWMNALSLASILQESWDEKKNKSRNAPNCGYFISNCFPQIPGQTNARNIWQPTQCQPVYANAPPKPRRLNDTSSPERSPDRLSEGGRVSRMAQPQEYPAKVYYQNRPPVVLPCNQMQLNNNERRTPDAYGRSMTAVSPAGKIMSSKSKLSDYEDVYKQHDITYQKVSYRNSQNSQPPNVVEEVKRFPPRPHSADFLEYDTKRQFEASTVQEPINQYRGTTQPQRPKSSLDMVHSNDSIYWSEESYARKMRQSSLYVSPKLQAISNSSRATTPSERYSQMLPSGNYCTTNKLASTIMKDHSEAIRQQERRWSEYLNSRDNKQFVRSASARLPTQQKEEKIADDTSDRSSITVFKRRNSTDSTIKCQQREESMKRLLEWKQRMLLSPLTRKSSVSSNLGTAQNELSKYKKQQVSGEIADQNERSSHCHKENIVTSEPHQVNNETTWQNNGEISKWDEIDESITQNYFDGKAPRRRHEESGKIRSRSQDGRNSVSRYNNYSSDDEEIEECRDREARKRIRKSSQSGRNRYSSEGTSAPDYENIDSTVNSNTNKGRLEYNQNFNKSDTTEYVNNFVKICSNSMDKIIKKKSTNSITSPQSYESNRVVNIQYDDRLTLSSKHSDSGYDTLQHGHLSQDSQLSDLLKFQFDSNQQLSCVPTLPLQTKFFPDEKWGLKLDESRVIKEFSYHYIKSDKESNNAGSCKYGYTHPQNIVQNRIKVFETTKDSDSETIDKMKAQDFLKLSPPLFHSIDKNLPFKDSETTSPVPSDKHEMSRPRKSGLEEKVYNLEKSDKHGSSKSVRDLLADFEKKSQLAKEKIAVEEENNDESPGKRYVFSDTETLLYDTSSDAEIENNESILSNLKKGNVILSDEEDRDEEVAAVLGKENNFISTCRDLGRKRESDRRKRKTSKSSLGDTAYMRLSMAESMVTHDDVDSNCSTPPTVSHKKEDSIAYETSLDNHEEHYMPMTPRKKSVLSPTIDIDSHSRVNSSSHTLTIEDFMSGEEENPYVVMTEKGISMSLLDSDNSDTLFVSKRNPGLVNSHIVNPESPRYCEIGNSDTHYEFIFKASTNQEPVYMEVNSIIDENKHDRDKRLTDSEIIKCKDNLQSRGGTEEVDLQQIVGKSSLPDILNSSAPPLNTGSVKSDSSDADDEASKDFDSIDAPRHPRFSLSDTFRPASYYLGASIGERALIGLTSEHQDSSDSDLVSPPPIPTSPPPLDDLETSLDSTISIKKGSPLPLKGTTYIENNEQLWNPLPLSGKDLNFVQTRINAPCRHLEEISSESDSIDSCKREQLLKRRPVSADILDSLSESNFIISSPSSGRKSAGSDLESIGSRNGLAAYLEDGECIDFDQYLEDLQVPNQSSGNINKDVTYNDFGINLKDKYDIRDQHCVDRIQKSYSDLNQETDDRQMQVVSVLSPDKKSNDSRFSEVYYENMQCMFPPSPHSETLEETSIERNLDSRLSPKGPSRNLSHMNGRLHLSGSDDKQTGAPYYYSDIIKVDGNPTQAGRAFILANSLSPRTQTLNNQRDTMIDGLVKRNDIGRKVNQIHQYPYQEETDEASRLAAELRSASAHLMAIGDKGEFDEKNIYVSGTLRQTKVKSLTGHSIYRSQTPDFSRDTRNLYPFGIRDKTASSSSSASVRGASEMQLQRRTRSLEGLLEEDFRTELRQHRGSPGNKIFRLLQTTQQPRGKAPLMKDTPPCSPDVRVPPPPPGAWEENALWRENLRRVSIRHTRSLDDLDRDSGPSNTESSPPKDPNKIVTYVNENISSGSRLSQQQYKEDYRKGTRDSKKTSDDLDDGVHYERLVRGTESLERIHRGQSYIDGYVWDEEHETFRRGDKAPSNARKLVQPFLEAGLYPTRPPSFEIDREKLRQWDLMSSAPAGMLSAGRATIKRPDQQLPTPTPPNSPASGSGSVIGRDPLLSLQVVVDKTPAPTPTVPSVGNSLSDSKRTESWNLNVSAGELLGRTHEELVLLLIQLRRQSAGLCKAMDNYHREIEAQAHLSYSDTQKRLEHLKKLDELRRHLLDLEKQYEKGKPLVNLVDNMVKLGSLYQAGSTTDPVPQRLEFNHKVQEQRLLAEERRDWERISPDHNQLQAKVEQLYRLDRLLQEESGTLQSLQQDKEMLERVLGGLRHKLQGLHGNPIETERYKRQQRLLEKELTRVRSILAENSKKLEETVAENARLEQELVVLRQKLQWSRRTAEPGGTTTAALEDELQRVQLLVGDLQRQRQELSLQVRQLTEKSHSLSQQIRPGPTGVAGAIVIIGKKRSGTSWLETDLDSQITHDIGLDTPCSSPPQLTPSISPLYVNTEPGDKVEQEQSSFDGNGFIDDGSESIASPPLASIQQLCRASEVDNDDRLRRYYGLVPKEKPQEIKTVRIVKRESERRQRDRDRSGCLGIPLTNSNSKRVTILEETVNRDSENKDILTRVLEEIHLSDVHHNSNQPNEPPPAPGPRSDSVIAVKNIVNRQNIIKNENETGKIITAREQLFGGSEGSPQLSPVYLSEAARQIVEEMAWRGRGRRRLIPKEKRRHHTVSGQPVIRYHAPYSPGGSRDDLDMERALRPRLNTPDVVRSTLSRTDPKFTTETIDNLLGTPGKIIIPERYIPESGPQLSKEEQLKRSKKADAIRKMLSETTTIAPVKPNVTEEEEKPSSLKNKVAEEKRQREHLLQLNQLLAQQVMEKSKIVAGVNLTVPQE